MDYIKYVKQYPLSMTGIGGLVGSFNFRGAGSSSLWYGERGIISGGEQAGYSDVIQYITISSTGNSIDFGDLTIARSSTGSAATNGRGLIAGGCCPRRDRIDAITVATTGNATDWGNMNNENMDGAGCADATRTYFACGENNSTPITNDIVFVGVDNPANAFNFGNLTLARYGLASASNGTRGVWCSGAKQASPNYSNNIDYITFASLGSAVDFGDNNIIVYQISGTGSTSRGIFAGGYSDDYGGSQNSISYITIANTGNASDFGDLTVARRGNAMSANETRATISGGYNGSTYKSIDYITMSSTGNASDFGDLLAIQLKISGCSNN